jgi:hypothetical protein
MADDLSPIFDQLRASQEARGRSMADVFNEALGSVDSMQALTPMPVPQTANPFGQMASVFAASLSDQLGSRGALAANEARLAQQKEDKARVEQANFARSQAFDHEKQMQRIGVLMKIGEAKARALEEGGDMDKFEAQVKANATLADKARKAQEAWDEKQLGIQHKNRLEEIAATAEGKKPTAEDKAAAAEAKEDELIRKFQEDIANVAKKPGNTAKTPAQKATGPEKFFLGAKDKPEVVDFTPAGIQSVLSRSAAMVRSANGARLQRVALETYFEYANNAGRISPGKLTPELKTLNDLANKVFTDDEEFNQWMREKGLAK